MRTPSAQPHAALDARAPTTASSTPREEARARIEGALAEAPSGARLLHAALVAPALPVDEALAILLRSDGEAPLLWEPPEGPAFAAVGAAARLPASPPLSEIAAWGIASLDGVAPAGSPYAGLHDRAGAAGAPAARWFGAVPFDPERALDGSDWSTFGPGGFVLPRLRYAVEGRRAWLTLVCAPNDPDDRARALADGTTILRRLEAAAARRPAGPGRDDGNGEHPAPAAPTSRVRAEEEEGARPSAAWRALLPTVLRAIDVGAFEKLVAAREVLVLAASPAQAIDPWTALARLRASSTDCTRFALGRSGATFLGASPELLVRRRGLEVRTEALAGSRSALGERTDGGALGPARALQSFAPDDKDLREHAPVLREIVARLGPYCLGVEAAASPEVRALRHVLHLRTPVSARLRAPTHVLELVAALHPTPAVAGLPSAGARAFLRDNEQVVRGCYAGPVGWFDAAGDGEFVVALRSALLLGDRAHLYAGAGIVAGSDPDAEWIETEWKLRPMRAALRING